MNLRATAATPPQGTIPVGRLSDETIDFEILSPLNSDRQRMVVPGLLAEICSTLWATHAFQKIGIADAWTGTVSGTSTGALNGTVSGTSTGALSCGFSVLLHQATSSLPVSFTGSKYQALLEGRAPEQPRILTTLGRFRRALDEWKGLLAPHHYDAMAYHLNRLLEDQDELDEDEVTPSLSSLDDLLAFLASQPWDTAPAVGLNSAGQFSASWAPAGPRRADITATFIGDGGVKWYAYGLGRRGKGSAAGRSERSDLPALLTKLGCSAWMSA